MAIGTDSRNIKKIIQSILQKHKIDSLQLEMDIFGAWTRYMNERENGETPAQARARIASSYNLGVSPEVAERARIRQLIEDTLKLNTNDTPEWERVISFCLKMDAKGNTIKAYQAWRESDPYNSPKDHQIAMKPDLIITTFPRSMVEAVEQREQGRGFYA